MANDDGASSPAKPAPKKASLLDSRSIKHLLDETISDVIKRKGYVEDTRLSSWKLAIGAAVIAVALLAQFCYPSEFPKNCDFLLLCIALYVVLSVVLQILTYTKEKSAILFTYPPAGSFNSTGLVISSELPRFSSMYTLTIASADPESISANKPVLFTKSVTKWFTKDGVLVEGFFWADVEKLIDDYNNGKSR